MSPDTKMSVSKFIYKAKDWTVIIGIITLVSTYWSLPRRVDSLEVSQKKLEQAQVEQSLDMREVKTGIKYLVREQKKE